jgi:hypothetical protein
MKRLILVLLIGLLAWKAVDHYRASRARTAEAARFAAMPAAPLAKALQAEPEVPASASAYRCDGRTMCSQMHSCEEATYFLQNCPGVKMDGNHDGIPCERQWCH